MTSQAERDVMGLMLTTNAEVVATVLRRTGGTEGDSVIAAIAATRSLGLIVEDTLRALVQQARQEGHTWAEVGDVLHVTRQAAFQRFGTSGATDTIEDGEAPALEGAEARARQLVDDFMGQRWDAVQTDFSKMMRDAVPLELLTSTWERIERQWGQLLEVGKPVVSVHEGHTVVDLPLAFERQDASSRATFSMDGEVVGLLFLRSES